MKKIAKRKLGLLLIAILLIGGLSGCMSKENDEVNEIVSYLEDRYDLKFVVDETIKKGVVESEYARYKLNLHPEENEELVFEAQKANNPDGGYYDNYLLSKWGNELTEKYSNQIKGMINNSTFKFKILSSAKEEAYEYKDKSAEEFIKDFSSSLEINFEIAIKVNSENERSDYYESILKLKELVSSFNAERCYLIIRFVNDEANVDEYFKNLSVTNTFLENTTDGVLGKIEFGDKININTVMDLEEKYENIGD